MSEPIIKVEELSYIYDESAENSIPALKNLSLDISPKKRLFYFHFHPTLYPVIVTEATKLSKSSVTSIR